MENGAWSTWMKSVGILIFDDVEVLDFCGPFEVFSVARRLGAVDRDPGGLLIEPRSSFEGAPHLDVLIVPGGTGTRKQRLNPVIAAWIQERDRQTEITASVCTGAFLLAEAGLLNRLRATTHWSSLECM